MSNQSTCKLCGAKATILHRNVFSHCGTWISTSNHAVSRSARCERDELRKRIDAAIYRAELAIQFGPTIDNALACVFACDVADVVKILRGNS